MKQQVDEKHKLMKQLTYKMHKWQVESDKLMKWWVHETAGRQNGR
jgi:hypothetical protein